MIGADDDDTSDDRADAGSSGSRVGSKQPLSSAETTSSPFSLFSKSRAGPTGGGAMNAPKYPLRTLSLLRYTKCC